MVKIGKTLKNLLYATAFAAGIYLLPSCNPDPKTLKQEVGLEITPSYGYSPVDVNIKVYKADPDAPDNIKKYKATIENKVIEKSTPIDTTIKLRNYNNYDKNYAVTGEIIDSEGNTNKKIKVVTVHPGKINRFVQPNDSTMNWRGSGIANDYNRVREPNLGDLEIMDQVIAGTYLNPNPNDKRLSKRLDVNLDGKVDSDDRKMESDKILGLIPHLSAYWNELNREERIDRFTKAIELEKTDEIPVTAENDCDQHVYQAIINMNGFLKQDLEKLLATFPYDTTDNGLENIPVDFMYIDFYDANNQRLGVAHAIATTIVGDELFNMNMPNRMSFESETDALNPDIGKDYVPSDHQEVLVQGPPLLSGYGEHGEFQIALSKYTTNYLKDEVFTFVEANPKLEFVTERGK